MQKRLLTGCLTLLALAITATSISAETLMMPKRDAVKGTPVVVWGVTTLPNGSSLIVDYGDGVVAPATPVGDRSYMAFQHTYLAAGNYTATMTVTSGATTETASVAIRVFDSAVLSADNLRSLKINMAIQDGLRWFWYSQEGRAFNFPGSSTTQWPGGGWRTSYAALVVLAFENHGYKLPNSNAPVTGLYEKYIVQRGLNYVVSGLTPITIASQPAGNPCQGAGSDCVALAERRHDTFHEAYTTGVAVLPLAASGALSRTNTAGGYTNGKSYGEILQRMTNAIVWGQIDGGTARGGWYYNFNGPSFDGSTVGWDLLALLDASAAGAIVPAFARTEFAFGLNGALNNDGTLDYQGNGNASSNYAVGPQKNGIGLQGLFFTGETTGARVAAVTNAISSWWNGSSGVGGNSWGGCPSGGYNKGCGYTMFNNFKGLKLHGIVTLPGVTRPAGPGAQPAGDWYADYQDWLVANQTAPNSPTGGNWAGMGFSCCDNTQALNAAIAELILSPVALVLPDEAKFAAFGLSPATDTKVEGGTHTVTAKAESTGGSAVPGATVNFEVLDGPNAGETGTGTTNNDGEATFTYTSTGGPGTDHIRASIGSLESNTVEMIWTPLNTPPVAADDAYTTAEDVSVASNVTANDSDADGDSLTASLVTGVANGTLVFNADGSFVYTPNADWFGTDSFTYKLNDGKADSNVATATITVTSVNDAPVCAAVPTMSVIWPPNHQWVSFTYTDASDIEGDTLTFTVTSIYQDEAVDSASSGNTGPDGQGIGTSTAQVRAERAGDPKQPGDGRVYHITFTATDGAGGSCSTTLKVGVPHDQRGSGPVDGGALFDSTVAPAATATSSSKKK